MKPKKNFFIQEFFRQVDFLRDTCQGDNAFPNGLDVTFEVTELRRLVGS